MRRRVNVLAAIATASLAVAGAVAVVALAPPAAAATLTEVTNFGFNPSNIRMYEYVPASAPAGAPILVAAHWCGGDGPAMYNGTEIASFADQFGFIVIYPSVTRSNRCWDVASAGALTHNGNSDPAGIR